MPSSQSDHESTPLLSTAASPHPLSKPKPHAFWLVPVLFIMAISMGMSTGPKLEIHTQLICRSLARDSVRQAEISAGGFLTVVQPDWVGRCRRDPEVSSRLAILSTASSLVMGFLSATTTAYWCSLSERVGRRSVLGWAFAGFVANDLAFLVLIRLMRSGRVSDYRMLVIPSFLEGLTGGPATLQAVFNSYIHDCAPPGRSVTVTFSLFVGIMMAGMALGPTISAALVPLSNDILLPFYVILVLLLLVLVFSLIVIPESLSQDRRIDFINRYNQHRAQLAASYAPVNSSLWRLIGLRVFQHRQMYLNFLKPLGIFWPRRSLETGQRNWNLFLIATAYALYSSSVGAYGVRLQYAVFRFEWGPVETGYYLTTLGLCRVISLLVILPLLIRLWKHALTPTRLALDPSTDHLGQSILEPTSPHPGLVSPTRSSGSSQTCIGGPETDSLKKASSLIETDDEDLPSLTNTPIHVSVPLSPDASQVLSDAKFDLKFARWSIVWDALSVAVLVGSSSAAGFVTGSGMQSLAGSTSAAMQALGLALVPRHAAGRAIASFSVIQVLTSGVLGPFVFGGVFSATVGKMSEAFFYVDLAMFGIVLMVLWKVRVEQPKEEDEHPWSDPSASS